MESSSAEKGIQLAREHRPDLILMDIQLPGMDGLTATRLIREDSSISDIPVVALTSHAMQGDEDRALAAGCDGYITKPIDTRSFCDSILQYIKRKSNPEEKNNVTFKNRILIVDDDPLNVKMLRSTLSKNSYEIVTAYDGESALEIIAEEHPDLILLDIMMPGIDGYEVTRRLKRDPATSHISILLITALDGADDKAKGLEAGADEFLNKPVNIPELRARVESLLCLKEYQEQFQAQIQYEDRTAESAQKELSEREAAKPPLILLVEDDPKYAKIIMKYLSQEAFRIVCVPDGEEAVAFAGKEAVDLMLLDLILPGMDGFEVVQNLRGMEQQRNLQVVAITGLDDMEDKLRGIHLGFDDYLVKPIHAEELKARVHALLKKKAYMDRLNKEADSPLKAAISDRLTGLFNPAYLTHFLDHEIKRSKRQKHPLALIIIDIDGFKNIDDTCEYVIDDSLLRGLGQEIKRNIREVDLPARYGGKRFAVVLPYADASGSRIAAKRIQGAVHDQFRGKENTDGTEKATVSMGISLFPSGAETVDELIRKADAALDEAKRVGKNRICMMDGDASVSDISSENVDSSRALIDAEKLNM